MTGSNNAQGSEFYRALVRNADRLRSEIAAKQLELKQVEASIAVSAALEPTPSAPQVDVQQCHCGGWLTPKEGVWVHERDGGIACQPGHSGPVAQPLPPTTSFPAVPPQDATQIIPASRPGSPAEECGNCEELVAKGPDGNWRHVGSRSFDCMPGHPESLRAHPCDPADLDQVPATPAADTLPDEAVRTDG